MVFANLKFPKLIYSTTSEYNERIEIHQIGKTKQLSVNNSVQSVNWDSPSVKNRFWGRLVSLIKEKRPQAGSVLMFGLGGGTIAHLLTKEMPKVNLTVVEIDEVIVGIAKDFFELDSIQNLNLVIADAMRVCSEPEKFDFHQSTFDVVIVDIYCGDKYPDLGKSGTFLSRVKWFVKPGGLVIFNRIYYGDHQLVVNEFIGLVENVFEGVKTLSIAGRTNSDNLLVYAEVQ